MKCTVDSQSFSIAFLTTFYPEPTPVGVYGHLVSHRVRCAVAEGEKFEADKIVATTDAYTSVRDAFDLHLGRKTALMRAMKTLNFTRDQRAQVWSAFVRTLPKPAPTAAALKRELRTANASIASLVQAIKQLDTGV